MQGNEATTRPAAAPEVVPMRTLDAAFKRGLARAGLDDLRFHDLGRTAITRMAEKLPNVIELAAISEHKSFMVLQQYFRPSASGLAQKYASLGLEIPCPNFVPLTRQKAGQG